LQTGSTWYASMANRIGVFLAAFSLSLPSVASPAERAPFSLADAPNIVSETGSLHIAPVGYYLTPFYNDYAGYTDKLLTNSMRAGRIGWIGGVSYDARLAWRYFTPSIKPRFGLEPVTNPVGRFADWLEAQVALARTKELPVGRLRTQVGIGLGHFGSKGARQLHIGFHKLIGETHEELTYDQQPVGLSASLGGDAGWVAPPLSWGAGSVSLMSLVGASASPVMTETYVGAYATVEVGPNIRFGGEAKHFWQHQSRILKGLQPTRLEFALGVTLFEWYRPTVKWVEDYIHQDRYPQVYLDVLSFCIPM